MFAILIVVVFFGIFSFRTGAYWKWVAYAYFLSVAVNLLASGGGTVNDPSGDGILTYLVRQATNDGPQVLLVGIPALIIGWGGFIIFIKRAWGVGKKVKSGEVSVEKIGLTRKVIEFVLLASFLLFNQIVSIKYPMNPEAVLGIFGVESTPNAVNANLSIEEELQIAANDLNKNLPQKIDEITQLNRVTSNALTMTYHYSIDSVEVDKNALKEFVMPNLIQGQCGNADTRSLIAEYGISYEYEYKLTDGSPLIKLLVDNQVCSNAGY